MPKVSVAIGIYNVGNTLAESLDSIFAQTFQDFEVVMCDDGSTDNTVNIANVYKEKYPEKVVIIQNEHNMGLNYTLNHCLQYVKGEYVARMDGDDLCDSTRFQKQVDFLDNHPEYGFVSSPMKYFDENGYWGVGNEKEYPTKDDFKNGSPFCHAPVMIRKEVYDAVNGYTVDKRLLRVEDYNLFTKIYALGYKGYNIQEPLYSMRDGRDAISRRKFKFRLNEFYARCIAIKKLHLSVSAYLYAFRPIIVGLLPLPIYKFMHKRNLKK